MTEQDTPLLSSSEKVESASRTLAMEQSQPPSNNELQFYDPNAILGVSREVAFGYLILLTGGVVDYEPPTLEDVKQRKNQSRSKSQTSTSQIKSGHVSLDEESASLAYAAIVDGNVLHPCFGLKATASGRVSNTPNNIVGSKNIHDKQSSILCCFSASPATLDALQLVLPHMTMNKLRMANLVEVLREVRDLHHEDRILSSGGGIDVTPGRDTGSLYTRVIEAYKTCFTSIIRYHDSKKYFMTKKEKGGSNKNGIIVCCSKFRKIFFMRLPKCNPQLEALQKETLNEIEVGFGGLREEIWERLERMANETAFTGVSVSVDGI